MALVSTSVTQHNINEENSSMRIYHSFLMLFIIVIFGCAKDDEIKDDKFAMEEKEYASYCLVYVFNPNFMMAKQTETRDLRNGGFIMRYEVT